MLNGLALILFSMPILKKRYIMRFFSFVKIGFIAFYSFVCLQRNHSSTVPTFSVDVQQRDSIEHFFSGYDYVMLETNENALLGNVEKNES